MAITKLEDVKARKSAKKALRSGQRAKAAGKRKPRILRDAVEATEVMERADKIIGSDAWRLGSLRSTKVLYLFSHAERVGKCLDGIVRIGRYPKLMRWKSGLKFDLLVVVAKPRWDRAEDNDRTRIVFHALRHFWTDSDGTLRKYEHDVETFYAEVEHFGLKIPEIAKVAEQLALFEHTKGARKD